MPKITVILPVYNSQKFIEQCLNSIVNQSLKDIEIICINDFSQDNSWDIVKNFAQNDSRFVLIENSENKKQGYCRNLGVVKAKSPYIHFIDSDDWINDLDFYKNVYEEIVNSDIDIYVFNYYEYHNDINILVEDEKCKRFPFLYDKFKMDTSLKVKASEIILSEGHTNTSYDNVKERLSKYDNANVVKGNIISDELPAEIEKICVANIDVDLYEAVKAALYKVKDKVVKNGIIIAEDYGHTPTLIGGQKAVDEFIEENKNDFIPLYMNSGQMFLIKK